MPGPYLILARSHATPNPHRNAVMMNMPFGASGATKAMTSTPSRAAAICNTMAGA